MFWLQIFATKDNSVSNSGELSNTAAAEEMDCESLLGPEPSTRMFPYISGPNWQVYHPQH